MTAKPRSRPPDSSARARELLERARKKSRRLAARDPEAVHDFRTALRRLRAELWLNQGLLGRRPGKRLRRRLGKLVRETGLVRDAEAGCELLARDNLREDRSLRRVLAGEARLPRPAAKRLRRKFREAARELERRLEKAPPALDREDAERRLARARATLPDVLRRALVTRQADLLHEARKQARKLRYAEESLFPRGGRNLKRLQDALGRERDLSVLGARAKAEGLAGLEKRLRAERDRILKSIPSTSNVGSAGDNSGRGAGRRVVETIRREAKNV